ncbi:MAG: class I SAM-dependent methyltransferase [Eubacteriales bacterium]|nr:class I SAM-dependent methyltransferase [Eubacteriales bacterium]
MNQIWSENVQGVLTLYLSRELRFHDAFQGQYRELFDLDGERQLRILEIGCGPGALAGALHRWYPQAEIVGLDRDSKFIAFAKDHVPGVTFLEGDATALPFSDGSFDVTISNTVSEHIDPDLFYSEQRRVLRENGVCLVLSARKGVKHLAPCMAETEAERRFWETVEVEDVVQKFGVGRYAMTEQQLPQAMECRGFHQVSAGYAVIPLTPDSASLPRQLAEQIIEADRQSALEILRSTHHPRAAEIEKIVQSKFDTRLELLRTGTHQWDTETAITMVVRGVKK